MILTSHEFVNGRTIDEGREKLQVYKLYDYTMGNLFNILLTESAILIWIRTGTGNKRK